MWVLRKCRLEAVPVLNAGKRALCYGGGDVEHGVMVELGWQRATQVIAEQPGEVQDWHPGNRLGLYKYSFGRFPKRQKGSVTDEGWRRERRVEGMGLSLQGPRMAGAGHRLISRTRRAAEKVDSMGPWVPPLRSQEREGLYRRQAKLACSTSLSTA